MQAQRSPFRYLIRPRAQLRGALNYLFIILLAQCAFGAFMIYSIHSVTDRIFSSYGVAPQAAAILQESINGFFIYMLFSALALSIFVGLYTIRLSHRVFGPFVPIKRHIAELAAGNYSSRFRLRRDDELGEIMEALNELAEALEARNQPLPKASSHDH